ncbi:MAG: RNA polymerase sigma factor [Phycisphaerales bacterium]|nr:MAG: RNA polymerase sigma factor [Phycisphaerales bacterium]
MRHTLERENSTNIRQGHREAYEKIICEHYSPIYRFAVYLSGDAGLAEDLTQETFTSAWANISHYDGRASLGTWLHRIAYHKFIDSQRSRERHAGLEAGLKEGSADARTSPNPLHQLAKDEHIRLLYEAMHKLDSSEYVAIVLHYVQGFSFREMTGVLDEPVGTIKWRTSQALKKLRAFLTGRIES